MAISQLDQVALVTAWTALPIIAGWANYGVGYNSAQYRINNNVVELRGLLRTSVAKAIGSTIATLPVGYRPVSRYLLDTIYFTGNGRIDVHNTGIITVQTAMALNTWVSLDNLSFSIL